MRPAIIFVFLVGIIGTAVSQEYIWQDANGGLGGTSAGFVELEYGTLLFASERGIVLQSTDQGVSWAYDGYQDPMPFYFPHLDSIISIARGVEEYSAVCVTATGEVQKLQPYRYYWQWDILDTLPKPGLRLVISDDGTMYTFDRSGGPVFRKSLGGSVWEQLPPSCLRIVRAGNGDLVGYDAVNAWRLKAGEQSWVRSITGSGTHPVTFITADSGNVYLIRQSPGGPGMTAECFVYRTTNGGETWTEVGSRQGRDGVVAAAPDGRVYLYTTMHAGYWESAGGTWVETSMPQETADLYAYSDGRVVAYSPAGMHLSEDYGATWAITRICVAAETGIIENFGDGHLLFQTPQRCYESEDYGLTWNEYEYTATKGVHFTEMQYGYAVEVPNGSTSKGTLVRRDYPVEWKPLMDFNALSDVRCFIPDYWKLTVVDNDTIAFSMNYGDYFAFRPVPAPGGVYASKGADYQYFGDNTGMYRTSSMGRSWHPVNTTPCTGTSLMYLDGAFIQKEEAQYSYDDGAAWLPMLTSLTPPSPGFKKIRSEHTLVIALTLDGNVVAATEFKNIFHSILVGKPDLYPVVDFALDENDIYAVRENGGVYRGVHTWNSFASPVDESIVPPHSFTLDAVYPNPVTASATVNYTLQSQASISLKLVDVLGRTVALIEEGRREPGAHSATVNTASLRPGMYFLRLETAAGVQTRPVAVVR